jgi:hypothetical protein
MLFNPFMNAKEMDLKFQEGLRLWNAGKSQECANIWMDLADFGHLDSIEQLTYIFLDQKEFEEVGRLIACAKNPNNPIIFYLKARLIEERDGIDAAMDSFRAASEAGSPNACLFMLNISIEQQNIEDAKFYLSRLAKHSEYSDNYQELRERIEELITESFYSSADSESANEVFKALASNPSCPEEILMKLAKDPDPVVRSAVAENSMTPLEILKTLAKDKSREVRECVARNNSTPGETLNVMAKVSYLHQTLAENPSISMALLKELSVNRNEDVRSAVARNPITPSEILLVLANDANYMVRHSVAQNPTTPPEALVFLAQEVGYMIRACVARNRNTPPELLEELASDERVEVRLTVALNAFAPLNLNFRINLLKSFGTEGDEFGYGRSVLAANPDTPVEILELFSKDKNHVVRCGVAVNPATPIGILKMLAKEESAKSESQIVQARVAENPSIPESLRREIIEDLVNDLEPWIRCHVGWNRQAPVDVLRSLAKDKWADVRAAVARNLVTPIEVLTLLAEDEHNSVRAAVAENPRTPEDTLRKLANLN